MPQLNLALAKVKTIQPNATVAAASNASPIIVATSAAHNFESGDIVQISGVSGNAAANGQFVVTLVDATHFSLNNSSGSGAYVSGGIAQHAGYATTPLLLDNTVFTIGVPDWTVKLRIESASAGFKGRFVFSDAVELSFATEQPGPEFGSSGAVSSSADKTCSFKKADFPDLRVGNPANYIRVKLLNVSVGGNCQFSSWIEW